jgi:hypothetical protein
MHGTGAALGDTAAKLGAGQTEHISHYPEQWHVGGNVELMPLAVNGQLDHKYLVRQRRLLEFRSL